MVISEPAIICLTASTERIKGWLRALSGRPAPAAPETAVAGLPLQPVVADAAVVSPLPTTAVAEQVPLTATERRARAAAFRGMMLARQRRFEPAEAAFEEAARRDPHLDLTAIPTFWQLERGAHEAAIHAYDAAGRQRDAQELTARMRNVFRPRLVAERPTRRVVAARE